MNYARLEKNIMDTIHEGQVKLGYVKESIRIYYFIGSLNGLLGTEAITEAEMDTILEGFPGAVKERLGNVEVSRNNGRYCFKISEEGVLYIHQKYKENRFLTQLIHAVQKPDCTIEDIKEVFYAKSEAFVCEKQTGQEFDYVIYFNDKTDDEFYYCFSIGQMGAYYHRFIESDYESVRN